MLPELRGVYLVMERIEQSDGTTLVLTSIEVWSDRLIIRYAADGTPEPRFEPLPPEERNPHAWHVTDDLGTEYRPGLGGSGGLPFVVGYLELTPTTPPAAHRLSVFPPIMDQEQPIEITLD